MSFARKKLVSKMLPFSENYVILLIIMLSLSVQAIPQSSSIYDVLTSHGLPMGLLPKGVKNFTFDNSGKFEVHLDQACNAKFENEFRYEMNVSGIIQYGQIGGLSGMSAQDLFLWFPVKEIRVDIPSSGLIYFDVGVVSKQFPLSSFESPRDCTAAQFVDRITFGKHIKSILSVFQRLVDQEEFTRAVLNIFPFKKFQALQ